MRRIMRLPNLTEWILTYSKVFVFAQFKIQTVTQDVKKNAFEKGKASLSL